MCKPTEGTLTKATNNTTRINHRFCDDPSSVSNEENSCYYTRNPPMNGSPTLDGIDLNIFSENNSTFLMGNYREGHVVLLIIFTLQATSALLRSLRDCLNWFQKSTSASFGAHLPKPRCRVWNMVHHYVIEDYVRMIPSISNGINIQYCLSFIAQSQKEILVNQ